MKSIILVAAIVAAGAFGTASAQETGSVAPPSQHPTTTPHENVISPAVFTSEVRLQGVVFGNFFQAATGQPTRDVNAVQVAYRAKYRPAGHRTEVYGEASAMKYTNITREKPYGLRAGVRKEDNRQAYEIFVDRGMHRQAFDVGNHTAIGTITTIAGEYTFNVVPKWELGAEALQEQQKFDVESTQANHYNRGGLSLRYKGFGYKFSPRVGYIVARRNVENRVDSYNEHYPYIQIITMPINRIYASVSYSIRQLHYTNVTDRSLEEVSRPQLTAFAAYRFNKTVSGTVYYSHENSHSPVSYRNFSTSFLIFGANVRF